MAISRGLRTLRLRRVTPAYFVLSLALCAACGAPAEPHPSGPEPIAAPEPEVAPAEAPPRGGTVIPVRFDHLDLVLRDQHRFEDPRLGTRLTYAQLEPALRVDVYVYPMAPPSVEVPDSIRTELVKRMFDQGKEDIRVYEERGRYEDVSFSPDHAVEYGAPGGTVQGWSTTADMISNDQRVDSHLVLVGVGTVYVKFRSTHPTGDEIRRDTVERFVEAFLGGMRRDP